MNTQTKIVWQISYSCDKEAYPLLWISKRLCLKKQRDFYVLLEWWHHKFGWICISYLQSSIFANFCKKKMESQIINNFPHSSYIKRNQCMIWFLCKRLLLLVHEENDRICFLNKWQTLNPEIISFKNGKFLFRISGRWVFTLQIDPIPT